MAKFVCFVLLLTISVLAYQTAGMPTPDEERYFYKEHNRELLNLLASFNSPQQIPDYCKYYFANSLIGPMPKRNSELINSLLSLPKNMNDAGK